MLKLSGHQPWFLQIYYSACFRYLSKLQTHLIIITSYKAETEASQKRV